MELWNELSKTVKSAADQTVKGAEKLTGIAKLKYKISDLNSKSDECLKNIGKLRYSESKGDAVSEDMYRPLFEELDDISTKIDGLNKSLSDLREYNTCVMCGCKVKKGLSYCPKCGEKLSETNK